jgi:general secretion pathway protein E
MTLDILRRSASLDPEVAITTLAEFMLARGLIENKTLERASRVAAESGQRLDIVLIQLGLIGERGLAEAYAELLGLQLATQERFPSEPLFPERLKPKFLRKARAVPLLIEEDALIVAMADPLDNFTRRSIATATGLPVRVEVAVPIELDSALDRLYPEMGTRHADTVDSLAAEGGEPLEEDAERLKDLASEAPVIRLVNQMIARAVETQASDIHIEPFEDHLRIRYRYDGVLHEAEPPPARLTAAIVSRIKIMSRLDIAERRLQQDCRIRLRTACGRRSTCQTESCW